MNTHRIRYTPTNGEPVPKSHGTTGPVYDARQWARYDNGLRYDPQAVARHHARAKELGPAISAAMLHRVLCCPSVLKWNG